MNYPIIVAKSYTESYVEAAKSAAKCAKLTYDLCQQTAKPGLNFTGTFGDHIKVNYIFKKEEDRTFPATGVHSILKIEAIDGSLDQRIANYIAILFENAGLALDLICVTKLITDPTLNVPEIVLLRPSKVLRQWGTEASIVTPTATRFRSDGI